MLARMDDDPDLRVLLEQEERLVFARFDHDTAWELGSRLRRAALDARLPVAIAIRRGGQRLFHCGLPGSSADNDGWLARKAAVVERYGHSSYYVGCEFRSRGGDFDADSRLDPAAFAAHGGAFPLLVSAAGCVGSVAVSGLPQVEDHAFVVAQLGQFLAEQAERARRAGPPGG
jgi:uncharacterized protein (UPF0303 family)